MRGGQSTASLHLLPLMPAIWLYFALIADQHSQATVKMPHKPEQGYATDSPAPKATTEFEEGATSPLDGLKLLLKQFRELKEYFLHFLAAKTDSIKLALRSTVLWLVLAALGFVSLSGLLVAAGWLMLSGTAGGLGVLFGDRWWLGNLVTGILFLAGLGLGIYVALAKSKGTSRERTVKKYEIRQAQQQSEFGRSASNQTEHAVTERE